MGTKNKGMVQLYRYGSLRKLSLYELPCTRTNIEIDIALKQVLLLFMVTFSDPAARANAQCFSP